VFGIVQMQDLHPFDAQTRQAFLQRSARAVGVEQPGFHVAVQLGGQDAPLGPAAQFAHDRSDPFLAAPHAVVVRRVEEPVRHLQHRADRRGGLTFVNAVAISSRHVPKAGGAEADRRYAQPRLANLSIRSVIVLSPRKP
jgi:hypothetical protein